MIDDEFSEVSKSALRDYSEDPRIDRIWQRLEADLAPKAAPSRAGVLLLWPALGLALFAAGVLVGQRRGLHSNSEPQAAAEVPSAEPARALSRPAGVRTPDPAASTQSVARRPIPSRAPVPSSAARGVEPELHATDVTLRGSAPQLPEWQQKAESGDFVAARAALGRTGGWDVALVAASPEQLMTLVDVARASAEREQAIRALRRLLDAYVGAPEAPVAAWTLGNLLEQSGDRAGAAEAYALYRRLSPTGDFAEDAAARQVDAALAQGNQELAAQLVEQYAKDYPNGRRLAEFHDELGKLGVEAADAGVPANPSLEPAATPSDPAVPASNDE